MSSSQTPTAQLTTTSTTTTSTTTTTPTISVSVPPNSSTSNSNSNSNSNSSNPSPSFSTSSTTTTNTILTSTTTTTATTSSTTSPTSVTATATSPTTTPIPTTSPTPTPTPIPTTSSNSTQNVKREIHDACWELLYIELLDTLVTKSVNNSSGTSNANPTGEEASLWSIDHANATKLEKMGFQVGQRLAERYTREKTRYQDTLEVIKFICKEFWLEIYKKQVDNLRTNRRGVYVLHDTKFRWLQKLSTSSSALAKEAANKYLIFPCGLIRGALANLGVPCDVSAEITSLPACNFTIKIKGL